MGEQRWAALTNEFTPVSNLCTTDALAQIDRAGIAPKIRTEATRRKIGSLSSIAKMKMITANKENGGNSTGPV
jgi:hypothetical protein